MRGTSPNPALFADVAESEATPFVVAEHDFVAFAGLDIARDQLDFASAAWQIDDEVRNPHTADPSTKVVDDLDASLERLGLTGRQKQLAGELSGGWKQRLALAACMLHDSDSDDQQNNTDALVILVLAHPLLVPAVAVGMVAVVVVLAATTVTTTTTTATTVEQ